MKAPALIPELSVTDLEKSLFFYVRTLWFRIEYERREEGFAMLGLGNIRIMLDSIGVGRDWVTARMEYPFGRGINLQMEVPSIEPLLVGVRQSGMESFLEPEEKWYRRGNIELWNRQFLIQDPDGYLLRFFESLGERPIT